MPPREVNQHQSKAGAAHAGQVVRDAEGRLLRTITVGEVEEGAAREEEHSRPKEQLVQKP